MNSAHNDQRDHAANFTSENPKLSLETFQIYQDMPPQNITFHVGNPAQEVMRISPGPPPRITVAEEVDISETAKAVLNCIEHMLPQTQQNYPRTPTEAMLIAARDWSYRKFGKPIGNDSATGCWQTMFDAASKGE